MPYNLARAIQLLKKIYLFQGVDEQMLEAAVKLMEAVEFSTEAQIFNEGDAPDYFYIIYSGRIRVSRYNRETGQAMPLGFLDEGDTFGHEVLEKDWPRQISAAAETEVTLLRLSVPNFAALLDILPFLGQRLQLILDSYRLMLRVRFAWLDPQEVIYYVARRHVFFLWWKLLAPIVFSFISIPILLTFVIGSASPIAPGVLMFLFALVGILWSLWVYIDWSNDYYIITNRRVVFQEKVILLYDSRQESPIEAVQSTSINTTQIGRILGYGNVAIRTYIGTILFRDVNRPDLIMSLIQEQQARSQTSQRRAELIAMEKTLRRRISGELEPPPSPRAGPPPTQPGTIQRLLSNLLHLRYESGPSVTYRTHWFILLKKTGLPFLLLFGIFILSLSRVFNLFTLMSVGSFCGINGLIGLVIFLWWLYQYLDWHNDIYIIGPDQIADVNKKPLGREERKVAPIRNILSIEYKRLGILGLLLNFGTVYIRVGDQQLTFDNVFNPAEVQRELFHRLAAKTYSDKQAQAENERQRMVDYLAIYDKIVRGDPSPPMNPPTREGF